MYRGPIFIGGLDRCGKTTLRAFLSSHPNIAIPAVGSNMWTYFYGRYGDLGREANFERCLAAMLAYSQVAHLEPDPARVRREFWEGEPTYARLFALLQRQYAERRGKPRWGDQTGLIERYAEPIFAAYPRAQIVHMLRDPRDRFEAARARHTRGRAGVGGATARWLYSLRLAERNSRRHPGRYLIVRFEDLVREPEATLRTICAFLDEPYAPTMLTMAEAPEHYAKFAQGAPAIAEGQPPLSPDYIGSYKGRLAAHELAFIQLHAGRAMRTRDYTPDPLRLPMGERLRFALYHWPLNFGRMLAWRGWEALQQRFPAQVGRRPDPKTLVGGPHVPSGATST